MKSAFQYFFCTFTRVRRLLSILLLLVLAVSLLPWAALELCPNKNNHHAGDEMHHGNCADGMMDQQDSGNTPDESSGNYAALSYQAPACTAVAPAVDDYSSAQNIHTPTLQQLVLMAVVLELAGLDLSGAQTFLPAPDLLNKSGPPLTDSPLRGPPSLTSAV